MKKIKLGSQGLEVSRIGLGCMGMSEFYKDQGKDDPIKTIQWALDQGLNFFDTADMYGPYENEILVGKALKERRKEAIITTKFGVVRGEAGEFLGINGHPEYVIKACEASLKRLNVDVIDLYILHRVDPKIPIEETVGAMKELVRRGSVRYIGLSEASAETIRKAHKIHPLTAVQSEYSLFSRDPEENDVQDVLRELGIGFIAYSPLGRGFLTGKFKKPQDIPEGDYRFKNPRFTGDNFFKNLKLEQKVEELAKRKGVKPNQIALAWLLNKGDDIVPIPGTSRIDHLRENIDAVNIVLSPEELRELDDAFPYGAASGNRYEDMSSVNL